MDIENERHKQLLNAAREKLEEIINSGEYCRIVLWVEGDSSNVIIEPMLWPEDTEGEEESEEEK